MTTPTKSSFFTKEPQVVQGFVIWLLAQVGALIVGHTDLFSASQWSGVASALTPIVTAVVIGIVTLVWRKWLSPAWKAASADLDKLPLGPQVKQIVETELEERLTELEDRFTEDDPAVSPTSIEVPVDQVDGTPTVGKPGPGESNRVANAGGEPAAPKPVKKPRAPRKPRAPKGVAPDPLTPQAG